MRPGGFGALFLAVTAIPGPVLGQDREAPSSRAAPPSRGPDRPLALGADGWVLERFGRDLAVLRTAATPPSGPAGLLVLSCEGGAGRWRLSLPRRLLPEGDSSTAGLVLVRPGGSTDRAPGATMGPVRIADGRVLTLTDGPVAAGGFLAAFVRLLGAGPGRIDLLLRGAGPDRHSVPFGSAIPAVVFAPVVGRGDITAFDDFLATCLAAPH